MGLYSDLQLNNGQYIPQYAGAPLKELQETADVLSTRHYGNLANASQLEILANQLKSELLPGAKSHVDKHIGALGEAIDEMAKSGGENSTARIMALANALKGDQGILNAGLRAKEHRKQTELRDALMAQGHTPVYDQERRTYLENASVDDPIYNTPYAAEVQPYKDPTKDWEQLLEKIKPDKWLAQGLAPDKANSVKTLLQAYRNGDIDMPLFLTQIQAQGVTKQKLKSLEDELMSSYRNMDSYSQQKNKNLGDGFGKSDEQIKEELMKYAKLYTYLQTDVDTKAIPRLGGLNKPGKPTADNFIGEEAIGAQKVGDVKFDFDLDQSEPRPPEQVNKVPYGLGVAGPGSGGSKQTFNGFTNNDNTFAKQQERYNEDYKAYQDYLSKLQTESDVASDALGLERADAKTNKKAAIANAQKYRDWVNARMQNQSMFTFDPSLVEQTTKEVMNNITRRKIYSIPDQEGNTTQDSDQQTRDDYNEFLAAKPEDVKITGNLNPLGPIARAAGPEFVDGYVVQHVNKDGKAKQYVVTKSDGELKAKPHLRAEFANQFYGAVSSKPGYKVSVPITLYNGAGREKAFELEAQEHVGRQREELINKLPDTPITLPNGSVITQKELARQYDKIFTVKVPGEKEERIYFSVNQVANDFIQD